MQDLEKVKQLSNHYFHAHRLKPTTPVDFSSLSGGILTDPSLVSDLKEARANYYKFFFEVRDLTGENLRDNVEEATKKYFSLLSGLTTDDKRNLVSFSWRSIAGPVIECTLSDSLYEICGVLFNQAVWYLGYSDYLISNLPSLPSQNQEKRKLAYNSLLKAAYAVDLLLEQYTGGILGAPDLCLEFEPSFLKALKNQCLAQAQEITIARAIDQDHKKALISKLCYDTSNLYQEGFNQINTFENPIPNRVFKFGEYLRYKSELYKVFGYYFQGCELQKNDDYGPAIACLIEAEKQIPNILKISEDYFRAIPQSKDKSMMTLPLNIQKILQADTAKFKRLNDGIAYAKIPEIPPEPFPPTSLVKPVNMELPDVDKRF